MERGFVAVHEEETDRGSRRAAEFTPCLEKAPSCLVPFLFSSLSFHLFPFRSFFRIRSPISFYLVYVPSPRLVDSSSILYHLFSTSPSSFARLVNASRPQRTLHTQLFTGRLLPSPSVQGEGLLDREPRRIALLQRGNVAILEVKERQDFLLGAIFFRGTTVSRWKIFIVSYVKVWNLSSHNWGLRIYILLKRKFQAISFVRNQTILLIILTN